MVRLPAGAYRPLYGQRGADTIHVAAFHLDRVAVTRGEFLAFVRSNPEWRRDRVAPLLADRRGYLADWPGATDAGHAADRRRPVTGVSWHAARAYCESLGKRLPTTHEWEYAAAASETRADATSDPAFVQRLVTLYASRPRPLPPVGSGFRTVHGVRDLHGRAWEWVEDFNSVLVSDDSRGVGARDHDAYCASAAIGALDPSNYAGFLRFAVRAGLTGRTTLGTLGFRCAA
jgi:formylglycine-generating enzyme required for sulfatase activity